MFEEEQVFDTQNPVAELFEAQDDKIAILEATVREKDQKIADLEAEVRVGIKQVYDLQATARDTEKKMADLKADVGTGNQRASDLQATVREKDKQIADLEADVGAGIKHASDLEFYRGELHKYIIDAGLLTSKYCQHPPGNRSENVPLTNTCLSRGDTNNQRASRPVPRLGYNKRENTQSLDRCGLC